MSNSPYFIILAGVDGVGKTTFYQTASELFYHSKRLESSNVIQLQQFSKEIVFKRNSNGNHFLQMIDEAVESRQSFFFETTLTHSFTSYKKAILKAHKYNYKVILYYIDSYDLGVIYNRLLDNHRVVSIDLLSEHYHTSHNRMFGLLPLVDSFTILDNTKYFEIKHMKWK